MCSVNSVACNHPNGGLSGTIPNGTTDYIWLGWQTMEERNPFAGSGSTDTPIKQYIWGTYIDECIQLTTLATLGPQNLPAGAYYLLQDLLYRAVALTNSSGSIVEAYDTDSYGVTMVFTGPGADGIWFTDDDAVSNYGANSIIFCGYRYDPESAKYYVRNRMYAPGPIPNGNTDVPVCGIGRWLQRDPIGYSGGINLYEYVGGRSVTMVDPAGRQPTIIIGLGLGFVGGCLLSAAIDWWSGESACQIARDCVCNGLGTAITGGSIASVEAIGLEGACIGAVLGQAAFLICQSLWRCPDDKGPPPIMDFCHDAAAIIGAISSCVGASAAVGSNAAQALEGKALGLVSSLFGLDCSVGEQCRK